MNELLLKTMLNLETINNFLEKKIDSVELKEHKENLIDLQKTITKIEHINIKIESNNINLPDDLVDLFAEYGLLAWHMHDIENLIRKMITNWSELS